MRSGLKVYAGGAVIGQRVCAEACGWRVLLYALLVLVQLAASSCTV